MREKYNAIDHSDRESSYSGDQRRKSSSPQTETFAEVFYYKKQMNARTKMVIVLCDDEEIEGIIEWYDAGALKLSRVGEPNLLVLKHNIKYLYKAEDSKD